MKILVRLFSLIIAASILFSALHAQQVADPNFDARVAHPAYAKNGPKVLFDEAHNNFHTASGRYKPFADLITNDGYQVTPSKQKFSAETLKGYDILVISNALGAAFDCVPCGRLRTHGFTTEMQQEPYLAHSDSRTSCL